MSRKKAVNSKVKKTKRPARNQLELIEKDFKIFPIKLQAALKKEIDTLKKQEAKLTASLKKMQKQQSAAKNKHFVLANKLKIKSTATSKKRLAAVVKLSDALNKAVATLTSQVNQVKEKGKVISLKKAKFNALFKHISDFDKNSSNSNKNTKKTAKTSAVATKVPRKKAQKVKANPENRAPVFAEPAVTNSTSSLVAETVEQ